MRRPHCDRGGRVYRIASGVSAVREGRKGDRTTRRVRGIKGRSTLLPMSALLPVSSTSPKRPNPRPFGAMLARRVTTIRRLAFRRTEWALIHSEGGEALRRAGLPILNIKWIPESIPRFRAQRKRMPPPSRALDFHSLPLPIRSPQPLDLGSCAHAHAPHGPGP